MDNTHILRNDVLRYKKNKAASNLALLGLVFNCLYFCMLYAVKQSLFADNSLTWWATWLIGVSVLYTLASLLVGFLSSEGIKGYNKKFCIPLLALAVIQVARIFIYPLYGLRKGLLTFTYFWIDPSSSVFEFIMMLIWLLASAACYVAAAVIGYINIRNLEQHEAAVESGEINMEAIIAEANQEANDTETTDETPITSTEVE